MINPNRTTGPMYPATATDTSGALAYWSSPNNAKVEDGSYAFDGNVGPGGGGHGGYALELTNFSMNIPSAAVIDGIKLEAKVSAFATGMHDDQIYLKWAGGSIGNFLNAPNYGQFWGSGTLSYLTWGGPTTLWGRTWTPAEINNAAFGAGLAGFPNTGTGQANIDAVRITVYWHYDAAVPPAEVPQRYDYKIYDPFGNFLGNLPGVTKPFSTTQALNSTGAQLTIEATGVPDGQKPSMALGRLNRWLNPSFKYRQRLRVNQGTISGGLASDVPLYIDLSQLDLGVQFWQNVDSTGKDIRFTDQYGAQELPFELINFNTTTKTGKIWFKGAVSTAYDTDFYIYYGNSTAVAYASTDPYGSKNVWGSYAGAYHLGDGTTLSLADSSPAGNTLTNGGSVTATTGKIDGAAAITGNTQFLQPANIINIPTNWEVTAWIQTPLPNTGAANYNTLVRGTASSPTGDHPVIVRHDDGLLGMYDNANGTGFNSSGFNMYTLSSGFHRLVAVGTGSTTSFYIDGVLVGIAGRKSSANIQHIGNYVSGGTGQTQQFGVLDEVRISNSQLRSAAYVSADYLTQQNPKTFFNVGTQEKQSVLDGSTTLLRNGNLVNVYETSYYYPNGKLKYQGQINRIEASLSPDVNGIIRAICHSDGRDMDNYIARGLPFTFTLDQQQTSQNTRVSNITQGVKGGGWDRWGQSWTANATSLGRIQLMLDGTANVTVNVYNSPSQAGGIIATTTQFVSVGGPTVIDFLFPDLVNTVVGQTYFFEAVLDANQSIWMQCSSSNPYANGSMYESNYGGGSGGGGYALVSGYDLYFTTSSGVPGTLATYTNSDPTTGMLQSVLNDYISRGGNIGYTAGTDIDATGLSLTASFNTNTIYEVLDKILSFSPSGFYYYVDLGTNKLRFKKTGRTADFTLVRGRHITEMDLAFSIENVINEELFTGGTVSNGPPPVNLYAKYTDATSKSLYGPRINRKSDNRVTVLATAAAIGTSDIQQFKDEQYYTTITVLARTMNITDIKLGQLCAPRGFGNYFDSMLLQITKIDYTPERAVLQVGTLPLRFTQGFEDVIRGLVAEQTVNNPSTPS